MKSKNIQGITIELNGDTKKLDSALHSVDSTVRSLQGELRGVESLLKLNPKNVELVNQKTTILEQSVKETEKKLEMLKKAQDQLDTENVDKDSEAYRDLQREIIATEGKLKSLKTSQANFIAKNSALGKVGDRFASMSGALDKASQKMQALSTAATAAIAATAGVALKGASLADEINTLSKVTGISTDKLQKYSYVADIVDVSVEDLAKAMAKTTKSMDSASNGSRSYEEAFRKLGVSIKDSSGKLRDNEDVFTDIVNALGSMKNETERDAVAMKLFGKSAQNLNPLIETGIDNISEMTGEMEDMGLVMSRDALDSANDLKDSVDKLKATATQAAMAISAKLAPKILPFLDKATKAVAKFVEKLKAADIEKIVKIGKITAVTAAASKALKVLSMITGTAGKAATGLSALITSCKTGTAVTEGMTGAQIALNTAIASNPAVVLVGGLAALAAALTVAAVETEKHTNAMWLDEQQARDTLETVKENKQAFEDLKTAQAEQAAGELSQISYAQSLEKELEGLADSSGHVKDKDKARAKFILNELNEALGTEYTLTKNQINNYDDLVKNIDKLIEKKKAQILLDAMEPEYAEAVKNRVAAEKKLDEISQQKVATLQNYRNLRMEEIELGKQIQEATEAGDEAELRSLGSKAVTLQNKIKIVKTTLDEEKQAYAEQDELLNGYYATITGYEQASTAALKGDSKKVQEILGGNGEAFITYSGKVGQASEEQKRILKLQADEYGRQAARMREKYKEGTQGVTEQMVKDAEEKAKKAEKEYEAAGGKISTGIKKGVDSKKSEVSGETEKTVSEAKDKAGKKAEGAKSVGEQLGSGIKKGLDNKTGIVVNAASALITSAITAMKQKAEIHSPSKVTEKQVGRRLAEGVSSGITKETKNTKKAVGDLIGATLLAAKATFDKSGFESAATKKAGLASSSIEKYTKTSISSVTKLVNEQVAKASKGLDKKGKAEMKKAGKAVIKSYTDAVKSYSASAKKLISDTLDGVAQQYEEKYKELVTKQTNLENKLADFGNIYSINSKGKVVLKDLKAQTQAITDYAKNLMTIKGKVSSELFDEIANMSVEDGQKYVSTLLSMSDKELKDYNAAYTAKLDTAKSLSEKIYKNDLTKLNKQYNDAVDKALNGLSGKLSKLGEQAMSGFLSGMKSQSKNLQKQAKAMANALIKQFKKELKIKSPSKRLADEVGKFLPLGLAKGMNDNVKAVEKAADSMMDAAIPSSSYSAALLNGSVSTGFGNSTAAIGSVLSGQSGGDSMVINALSSILVAIKEGKTIILDSGALVGSTAKQMNTAISKINMKERWL